MPLNREESVYILVIEDDQELREFLADQLTTQGYKVMTADNGSDAVECVQNSKFHVVISGLRMPGMDGIATLEAIKKIDPQIPVIMTSGHGNVETVMDAMKKGAFHFLHKPIVMSELFLLIKKAYESSKDLFLSSKLEILLETVMNRLQVLFHADEGSFMLTDNHGGLYIAYSRGLPEETVYSTALMLGERIAGLAAKERRELLITGGLENYPEFRGIEKKQRISSSIVVPVYYEQKLIGVLNLNRTVTSRNFTEEDLKGVSIFVSQIAEVVQKAKLDSDLEAKTREFKSDSKKSI